MRIAIIGTGGVGGYFGGKLAKAGNDVTFFARGAHLKAIQENGLTVNSILGNFKLEKVKATDNIEAIGKVYLVVLALKAWQVKDIAVFLPSILHDDSTVLTLQNGVTIPEELKEYISPKHILSGLCRIISKIESPGVINHFGVEPTIIFGEPNNTKTERANKINELFDKAEIKAFISRDIDADLWKKFISICISGLMAVSKCSYGAVAANYGTRQLMIELFNEIYQLSQKMGIHIESDYVEKNVAIIDSFPFDSTTSLARDVWDGKPSEIEYQNGTVVKLAEKYGVDVPVNRFVYYCILPMEEKARKR